MKRASCNQYHSGMELDCNLDISDIVLDSCTIPLGVDDYNELKNKPRINGVELVGDLSSHDIHVQHEMDEITNEEIHQIIYGRRRNG